MSEIVKIFDVSYEGAGVGKIAGQIVFVPKTLIGETVEIDIVKKTNSFLVGKVKKVVCASQQRIAPNCPYFDVCGGCDFQHCSWQYEQQMKIQILKKELSKIEYANEIEFVPSSSRFAYRNKIKLEVIDGKLGYFKAQSHDFFEIETCPIASENIEKALPKLKEFLKGNSFKKLKNIYIKQVDENVAICLLFDKNCHKYEKNIKKLQILSEFSVFFAYGDVLESNKTQVFHVFGNAKLIKKYEDFEAVVDVSSFNQINDDVAKKMYDEIVEMTKGKRVINAYSGQGLLTKLIAKNAKFVYGIEMQRFAHESAQRLTTQHNNVENICGKVEEKLPEVFLRDRLDLLVLDPAREGCKATVLEEILKNDAKQIVYVSCNFSTLVRDLRKLKKKYCIEKVKIFDMFPATCNMETLVILRAK